MDQQIMILYFNMWLRKYNNKQKGKIMTKEEQKEYDNAKEDYEELANSMSKQDLIDFYVKKMLEDNYVITERESYGANKTITK